MRPGMTGLGQVNGNNFLNKKARADYDVSYVNHFSLSLDLKILLKTVPVIIFGEELFLKRQKTRCAPECDCQSRNNNTD